MKRAAGARTLASKLTPSQHHAHTFSTFPPQPGSGTLNAVLGTLKERCPPRHKSRVERLKAKVEPLLPSVTVECCVGDVQWGRGVRPRDVGGWRGPRGGGAGLSKEDLTPLRAGSHIPNTRLTPFSHHQAHTFPTFPLQPGSGTLNPVLGTCPYVSSDFPHWRKVVVLINKPPPPAAGARCPTPRRGWLGRTRGGGRDSPCSLVTVLG